MRQFLDPRRSKCGRGGATIRLAPEGHGYLHSCVAADGNHDAKRAALDLDLLLILGAPHPWRITGTPSLGEVPSGGARAIWLLSRFSKMTRRKGGTNSSRYRRNGYVHGLIQHPGRLSGRHREQAPSHIWTETISQILVGCQAAIGGRPPSTFGPGHSFSAREVWPSQPPPSAAISCTLATSRDCSKFSTVRSLLRAVACTVTTSR